MVVETSWQMQANIDDIYLVPCRLSSCILPDKSTANECLSQPFVAIHHAAVAGQDTISMEVRGYTTQSALESNSRSTTGRPNPICNTLCGIFRAEQNSNCTVLLIP